MIHCHGHSGPGFACRSPEYCTPNVCSRNARDIVKGPSASSLGIQPYQSLDYIKTPEDLEAYVQERIRQTLAARAA